MKRENMEFSCIMEKPQARFFWYNSNSFDFLSLSPPLSFPPPLSLSLSSVICSSVGLFVRLPAGLSVSLSIFILLRFLQFTVRKCFNPSTGAWSIFVRKIVSLRE